MGWNSFDSYGIFLDEPLAIACANVLATQLRPFGYDTFVIDMGWYAEFDRPDGRRFPRTDQRPSLHIDDYGRYVAAPTIFPRGMRFVADYVHRLGLRFGLHIMRGIPRIAVERNLPVFGTQLRARDVADLTSTCRWNDYNYGVDVTRPGADAYYESVAALLASWEVDFVKADDIVPYPAEVAALADALARQSRAITLSLSPGNTVDYSHLDAYRRAQMVRLTRDVWDLDVSIERCLTAWEAWCAAGMTGVLPDLDMIPLGELRVCSPESAQEPAEPPPKEGYQRACRWTAGQKRTFLAALAVSGSPLFWGVNPLSLDHETWQLLTNPTVIRCNQAPAVRHVVRSESGIHVWRAHAVGEGWLAIINRSSMDARLDLTREVRAAVNGGFSEAWGGQMDGGTIVVPAGDAALVAWQERR